MRKAYVFARSPKSSIESKALRMPVLPHSMFLSEAFGAMSHEKASKELGWTPRLFPTPSQMPSAGIAHKTSDAIGVDREENALLLVVLAVTVTAFTAGRFTAPAPRFDAQAWIPRTPWMPPSRSSFRHSAIPWRCIKPMKILMTP